MPAITQLAPIGCMGGRYNFLPKDPASIPIEIITTFDVCWREPLERAHFVEDTSQAHFRENIDRAHHIEPNEC